MTCCRCCDGSARATATLQNYRDRIAAGGQPATDLERLWFAHPENVCWCPDADRADWCRCRHCLSWLRRAPRCHLQDCTLPATHPWSQSTKGPPRCIVHEREHLERQRAASRRARAIRTPPRPPHEATKGTCSMCGTSPLPGRRRSWCSDTCVDLWNLAASAQVAKHRRPQRVRHPAGTRRRRVGARRLDEPLEHVHQAMTTTA